MKKPFTFFSGVAFLGFAVSFACQSMSWAGRSSADVKLVCDVAAKLDEYARALYEKRSPKVQLTGSLASLFKEYLTKGEAAYAKELVGTKDQFGRTITEQSAKMEATGSLKGAMYALKAAKKDCDQP